MITRFKVEDSSTVYEVDIESGDCACGEDECPHIKIARQYASGSRALSFIMISAFHKELRRGDYFRALNYAYWLQPYRKAENIIKYLRSIVFEETRNVHLVDELNRCARNNDLSRAVALFSMSCKKWEGPDRLDIFMAEAGGIQIAIDMGELTDSERSMNPLVFSTFAEAVIHYWRGKLFDHDKTWRGAYFLMLKELCRNKTAQFVLRNTKSLNDYLIFAALEVEYGVHSHYCNAYHKLDSIEYEYKNRLLMFEPYVHDFHTFVGKAKVKKNWHGIAPSVPLPDGLDLRFTGSLIGLIWRIKAYQQFGIKYIHKSWHDVNISNDEWAAAKMYDSRFYKSHYLKQGEPVASQRR